MIVRSRRDGLLVVMGIGKGNERGGAWGGYQMLCCGVFG